jgi:hypothetical protein
VCEEAYDGDNFCAFCEGRVHENCTVVHGEYIICLDCYELEKDNL